MIALLAVVLLPLQPMPAWGSAEIVARVPVVESADAFGHACPVPWGLVTAAHVATADRGVSVRGNAMPAAWIHPVMDIARWPLPEGIVPLPVDLDPVGGQEVLTLGYTAFFAPRVVSGLLLGPVGGTGTRWVISDSPGHGASGSCVVNAQTGRVVGILIEGQQTGPGEWIGIMLPIGLSRP